MLSQTRYNIAHTFGHNLAAQMFIDFLNPKYRGPEFKWENLPKLAASMARVSVYQAAPKGNWGRDKKEMQEIAGNSAFYATEQFIKDSGVLEWLDLGPKT